MRDPYQTLGVSNGASDSEIKRTYRRLAKELHPDVNPGDNAVAERFKEVSAAYHLLGDKEMRGRYDRGEIGPDGQDRPQFRYEYAGGPGQSRSGGFSGFGGGEDIFRDFATFFGGARGPRQNRPLRGVDRSYRITVDFLDAARGTKRRISLPNGKILDIRIPAGIEDGRSIRLKGQGEEGRSGAEFGDALIEVSVEAHPHFSRDGIDVHLELPVSLAEAVLGAKISVPTIDGNVTMTIPKGSNTGSRLRLKNRGIDDGERRGDQYVILKVVLPDSPDAELTAFLERWEAGKHDDVRKKAGL